MATATTAVAFASHPWSWTSAGPSDIGVTVPQR
jgi:hypothetical protein